MTLHSKLSLMVFEEAKDWLLNNNDNKMSNTGTPSHRQFIPTKELCEQDLILIDMLNSAGHEDVCYCICDPDLDDLPIIFASDGFCQMTQYEAHEIQGRNCRFLQGPETNPEDVQKIRQAITASTTTSSSSSDDNDKNTKNKNTNTTKEAVSVNLLNYKKDGTTFCNEFFLQALTCPKTGRRQYFIGVQKMVPKLGSGQMASNVGWVYTQGNHA